MYKKVFFPSVLDSSKYMSSNVFNPAKYKTFIKEDDEDIYFQVKMSCAIDKIIELSGLFDFVYLESVDYLFVLKDIIKNYDDECIDIIKHVSFVDFPIYNLFYKNNNENKWTIAISCFPRKNVDDILSEFIAMNVSKKILTAIKKSISNRLFIEDKDVKSMADGAVQEIKEGFYEGFCLSDNGHLNINDYTREFVDLVLLNYRNNYICDLIGIDTIYRSSFEYEIEKNKLSFTNLIGYTKAIFSNKVIPNLILPIHNREKNIQELLCELGTISIFDDLKYSNYNNFKEINIISYNNCYNNLKYSISSVEKYEYGNSIFFICENNKEKEIRFIEFKEYFDSLKKYGEFNRTSRFFIKITQRKYAKALIEKGQIKFSKPRLWVEQFNKDLKAGQGDPLEGVLKVKVTKDNHNIKCTRYYRNQNDSILDNYTWCCYGLDNLHFVYKDNNYPKAIIKEKFFKDFESYTKEEEKNIDYDEQLVVIFINPQKFVGKLFTYFKNNNYSKYHFHPITYIDKRNEKINLKCDYPFELFYKDKYFMNQNEIRCVLESDNSEFYSNLIRHNGIIEIGNLSDCISGVYDYYFKELSITMVSDTKVIFELPHDVSKSLYEMSLYDLLDTFYADFSKNQYYINEEKINFFNEYFKKYQMFIRLEDTKLVFYGLTEENQNVIDNVLDRYIGIINFRIEMNKYYESNNIDKFEKLLKLYEDNDNYVIEVLYFKALLEYHYQNYNDALSYILKCKEKSSYNKEIELLYVKIIRHFNDKDAIIYFCKKFIEKFGYDSEVMDILNTYN